MSSAFPTDKWEMLYPHQMPDDLEYVCSFCGREWAGTRTGTEWTELDRQDHKGPRTIAITNCCNRRAGQFHATREPKGYFRRPHPVAGGDVFYRRRTLPSNQEAQR
jgi:hypothetical protein